MGLLFDDFPDYAVGSAAYFFYDLEAFADVGLDFLVVGHLLSIIL